MATAATASESAERPEVEVRRSSRRRRTVAAYREDDKVIVMIPARLSVAEAHEWVATMVARLGFVYAKRQVYPALPKAAGPAVLGDRLRAGARARTPSRGRAHAGVLVVGRHLPESGACQGFPGGVRGQALTRRCRCVAAPGCFFARGMDGLQAAQRS